MERSRIDNIHDRALRGEVPCWQDVVELCDAALANAVDCEELAEKVVEVHRDFDGSFSTSMFGVTVLHTATKEQCEASAKECRESIAAALRSDLAAKPQDEGEYPLYLRAAKPATPPTCAVSEQIVRVVEVLWKVPMYSMLPELQDAVADLFQDSKNWRSQIATVVAEFDNIQDLWERGHQLKEGEAVAVIRKGGAK